MQVLIPSPPPPPSSDGHTHWPGGNCICQLTVSLHQHDALISPCLGEHKAYPQLLIIVFVAGGFSAYFLTSFQAKELDAAGQTQLKPSIQDWVE